MCVLIVKPAGVKMPSYDLLKQAYQANPHGCGFATKYDYFKTLSFDTFMKRLSSVGDDEDVIIHFRLATHGSIKRANCHPFKKGNIYFAHNGILNITPIGDKTDSETAFIKYIYPAIVKYGLGSPECDDVVFSLLGYSKFAILQEDNVRLFGDFTQVDGVYYSNLRFMRYNSKLFNIA